MKPFLLSILMLSVYIGRAAAGVSEPEGYRLENYGAPVPDTVQGSRTIHTTELKALLDHAEALPIDVFPSPRRPEGMRADQPWMPVPHRDIPGSLWLPDIGQGQISPDLDRWFRERLARAGVNTHHVFVFYCRSQCWLSWNAAKRAASYGYSNIVWYPDGVDGWEAAGLPLMEATPEQFVLPPAK
jgi:PQQ-dependent catabolism-associated CXXCW motif protein